MGDQILLIPMVMVFLVMGNDVLIIFIMIEYDDDSWKRILRYHGD